MSYKTIEKKIIITTDSDDEMESLIKLIKQYYLEHPKMDLLQQAIDKAIELIKLGKSFTYSDIGLDGRINHRQARQFKAWADLNGLKYSRAKISQRGGSQGMIFHPPADFSAWAEAFSVSQ